MKIFKGIIALLPIAFFVVLPCADAFFKHKREPKKEVIKHTLEPLLCYCGLLLVAVIFIVLFGLLCKLFKNLFVAGVLSVAISVPIINYFGNK